MSLVDQFPYHIIYSLTTAVAIWLRAKFLIAGARKDGGCVPSKSTQIDKPPGICSNTDLSRLDSILPIRSCSGGSSNMRVVSEISDGSYGTIAIMLTAETSMSSQ